MKNSKDFMLYFCVALLAVAVFFNAWAVRDGAKEGFSFSQELRASNKLTPDTFVSAPRFTASRLLSAKIALNAEEKALISATFNEILARVAQDKLCRGGSYTVEPTFSYKNGVEMPKGQRVEASLSCQIKQNELDAYNKLLNDIDKIAARSGFISMSMPALRAHFDTEVLRANENTLREKLIKTALAASEHYSKLTNKRCELKNLDFSRQSFGSRNYKMSATAEEAMADGATAFENALPVVGEEERTLSANATYGCR